MAATQTKSFQLSQHLQEKTKANETLSARYEDLLTSERHWDCVFYIGGHRIKCHKLILSSASSVFEAMFYGPIREEQSEIEIPDIRSEIFRLLLRYIYTGRLDFALLTLEETVELYYSAEKYFLDELVDLCLGAIAQKLRFCNILPALELSVCLDLSGLLNVCMSFFTRCCLGDPQYLMYLKSNYLHVSKDCIKSIIAANKDLHKNLLWFVYEWCQQECTELGTPKVDFALLLDDLELKVGGIEGETLLNLDTSTAKTPPANTKPIERGYFKACRPFVIDHDEHEWKLNLRSDRFISLQGLIMHSRLTPNFGGFASRYSENLTIEIRARNPSEVVEVGAETPPKIIWRYEIKDQATNFNCDLNLRWTEGVILSPDVDYEVRLIWPTSAFGAEYPCALQSDTVEGIQFREGSTAAYGSPVKGIHFMDLV